MCGQTEVNVIPFSVAADLVGVIFTVRLHSFNKTQEDLDSTQVSLV